jgi:hypothetical protein
MTASTHGGDALPTFPDWLEISQLIRRAPHALDEVEELLTLYDSGRLSLGALKCSLCALAIKH